MRTATLRERIGGAWTERTDGWWRPAAAEEVRGVAQAMRAGGARFAALVASPAGAGALRLSWHFDLAGTLLSLHGTLAAGAAVPSIVDLFAGADWAEREARDYYGVTFTGRATTAPLMLREGDEPGLLLRGEGGRL